MKKIIVTILVAPLFLTACDDKKTVEYWNSHKDERSHYLELCRNGSVDRGSQNCENARLSLTFDPDQFK